MYRLQEAGAWREFKRKLTSCLQKRKWSYVIKDLAGKTTGPDIENEDEKVQAAAKAKVLDETACVFGVLSDALSAVDYKILLPTAADEEALEHNPNLFYKLMEKYSKGVVEEEAVADNMSEFMDTQWLVTTDGKSLDLQQQAEATMAKMMTHVEKSVLLGDDSINVTEALACNRFIKLMPMTLKLGNHAGLKPLKKVSTLMAKVRGIIYDLGGNGANLSESPALLMTLLQQLGYAGATPATLPAQIGQHPPFGKDMSGNQPRESGRYQSFSKARRFDQAAGPPDSKSQWCASGKHGWCRHSVCDPNYVYTPGGRNQQSGGGQQRALMASIQQLTQALSNSGNHVALLARSSYDALQDTVVLAQAQGISLEQLVFVDCGAEIDICNNESQMVPGTLQLFDTPKLMAGVGTCKYVGEGQRAKLFDCGNGLCIAYQTHTMFAPDSPFQVHSTDRIADAGVSIKIDSTTVNNQLSLYIPHTTHEVKCVKVGKLWAAPLCETTSTVTTTIGAHAELHAIGSSGCSTLIWDGISFHADKITPKIPPQPTILAAILAYGCHFHVPYDLVPLEAIANSSSGFDGWAEDFTIRNSPQIATPSGTTRCTEVDVDQVHGAPPPSGHDGDDGDSDSGSDTDVPDLVGSSASEDDTDTDSDYDAVPTSLTTVPVSPERKRIKRQLYKQRVKQKKLVATGRYKAFKPPPAGSTFSQPPAPQSTDRKLKYTRTVDAAVYRAELGASERRTRSTAKKLGVKLTNLNSAAAKQLDQQMRIANQPARALVKLGSSSKLEKGLHFGADTLGGQQPTSLLGNSYVIHWQVLDPVASKRASYVTFAADHSAASSVRGLQIFVQESGFDYNVGQSSVSQGVTFWADNGTEFQGAFRQRLEQDGINIRLGTAHKKNTGAAPFLENGNKDLQKRMRTNLKFADVNLKADGHDPTKLWDLAMAHGARQDRFEQEVAALSEGDTAGADELDGRMRRALRVHFGARVTPTLQPTAPARLQQGKQLADRAVAGLFCGMDRSGRYIILLPSGKFMMTVDIAIGAVMPDFHPEIVDFDGADSDDAAFPVPHQHDDDAGAPDFDLANGDAGDGSDDDAPAHPPLHDKTGQPVTNGDRVGWPWGDSNFGHKTMTDFPGTVQDIGLDSPTKFTIEYDTFDADGYRIDGESTAHKHAIDAAAEVMTKLDDEDDDEPPIVNTARRQQKWSTHPTVQKYVGTDGQILPDILTGEIELPPLPPLPDYTRAKHPAPPTSVLEALSRDDAYFWLTATVKEYTTLHRIAFRYRTKSSTEHMRRGLQLKWVSAYKFGADGAITKFKQRLVAAAWQAKKGVDFEESYIGSPPVADLRTLECMAIEKGWGRMELDVTCAYVSADCPPQVNGDPVIASMPDGTKLHGVDGTELSIELLRALYGWGASGWAWARKLHGTLAAGDCPVSLVQSHHQPSIFYAKSEPGSQFYGQTLIVWINVDNVRTYYSSPDMNTTFINWYSTKFDITGGEADLAILPPQVCLGMTLTYTVEDGITKSVKFDMDAFIEQVLTNHDMQDCNSRDAPLPVNFTLSKLDKPASVAEEQLAIDKFNKIFKRQVHTYKQLTKAYQSSVQAMNWLATMNAPTLRTAISFLARGSHYPCEKGVAAVKQCLRYIKGLIGQGITYYKYRDYADGEYPELVFGSDASFANHPDAKCQGGFTGRFKHQAITTAVTGKSSTVCNSTTQAESFWGAEACREMMYVIQWLHEVGLKVQLPVTLHIDNMATVTDAGSPIRRFSQRTKHFLISEKYAQQCSEMGLVKIIHRAGADLDADAMTKALPGSVLKKHTTTLLNGSAENRG